MYSWWSETGKMMYIGCIDVLIYLSEMCTYVVVKVTLATLESFTFTLHTYLQI